MGCDAGAFARLRLPLVPTSSQSSLVRDVYFIVLSLQIWFPKAFPQSPFGVHSIYLYIGDPMCAVLRLEYHIKHALVF
jgi:hypothetical protein